MQTIESGQMYVVSVEENEAFICLHPNYGEAYPLPVKPEILKLHGLKDGDVFTFEHSKQTGWCIHKVPETPMTREQVAAENERLKRMFVGL